MKIAPTSIANQYGTKLNSSNYGKENVSNVSLNNQSVPNFKANPELTKKALGTIKGMLKEVPDDAVEKLLVSFGGIVATLGLSVEKQAIETKDIKTKEIKTKEMPFINT